MTVGERTTKIYILVVLISVHYANMTLASSACVTLTLHFVHPGHDKHEC